MNKIIILCLILFFSIQTHGAGKWRERASRFLPFVAPKALKLEKKRKKQLTQRLASLSDLELVVLDLELRGHSDNIETIEQMDQLAKREIYKRMTKDEQTEVLKTFVPELNTRPGSILNNEKAFPLPISQDPKGILQKFLSVNAGNTTALVPNPKHLKDFIAATQSIDASINILQKALNGEKSVGEFFTAFDTVAWPSPSDEYRNALDDFFTVYAEKIGKLPLSAEQVRRIGNYVYYVPTFLTLLKGGLKRANGDGDSFFAIFKAVTDYTNKPDDGYRKGLDRFFTINAEEIRKLGLSAEQVRYIGEYVYYVPTFLTLLKGGLKQANGDADRFFAIFKAVTDYTNKPDDEYRKALDRFFTNNTEEIGKLSLSAEQVRHIGKQVHCTSTYITLLKGSLKQANRNADSFFAMFKAVTDFSNLGDEYRDTLSKFFTGNAEEIAKLHLSSHQIKHIANKILRIETNISLMQAGLKQAQGDAGKFFTIFNGLVAATPSPNKKYRDALNSFFVDNTEKIMNLNPSPEQIVELNNFMGRSCASSAAALLSLGTLPKNTESEI